MGAGWVAGSVRAQALARRRIGTAAVRTLARSTSVAQAVRSLASSPYGGSLHADADLAQAQRAVADAVLWNLRVLAGWLPPAGARTLRVLAGWFEIANVDEHLRRLDGLPSERPFQLGALATAWPRLAPTGTPGELRDVLAGSLWGDPGGHSAREIGLSMRVSWARRVATRVEGAAPWALGAVALLVAREQIAAGLRIPERPSRGVTAMLGPGWADATTLPALRSALPSRARWALRDTDHSGQLWRAETRWWARLRSDGAALAAGSGFGGGEALGTVALQAVDAWRVRGALEICARHVDPEVLFDVLA